MKEKYRVIGTNYGKGEYALSRHRVHQNYICFHHSNDEMIDNNRCGKVDKYSNKCMLYIDHDGDCRDCNDDPLFDEDRNVVEHLVGLSDVEVAFNNNKNRWEIRVGDEECQRIYVTDFEPSIRKIE